MAPESALLTWPLWGPALDRAPTLVCELEEGLTNRNWLLDTSVGKAVLRIAHPDEALLGIDRGREALVMQALSGKFYVPELWYHNPFDGIQVTKWVTGELFSADTLPRQLSPVLADCIHRYQQVPVDLPKFDYEGYLLRYWTKASLIKDAIQEIWLDPWEAFLPRIRDFQASPWQPVLCHHDLTGKNLVYDNAGMTVLDWEYAAMGHQGFDFVSAGLERFADLPDDEVDTLRQIHQWLDRLWWALRH